MLDDVCDDDGGGGDGVGGKILVKKLLITKPIEKNQTFRPPAAVV